MTKSLSKILWILTILPMTVHSSKKGSNGFSHSSLKNIQEDHPFFSIHFGHKKNKNKVKESAMGQKKKTTQGEKKRKIQKKKKKKISSRRQYCQEACEGTSNVGIRDACEYQCENPGEATFVRTKSSGGDDGFSFLSEFTNVAIKNNNNL